MSEHEQDIPEIHPGTDVARSEEYNRAQEEFALTYRLAKVLAASKRFPDAMAAEQALAKIYVGKELGMTPTQSMLGIHIVEGKPQVASVTLAAFVRKHPSYDYDILELTNERCRIQFLRDGKPIPFALEPGEEPGVSKFTIQDAEKAGLIKTKGAYEKTPRNMLFARAMSNGVKWFCPDATQGMPVYYDGEFGDAIEGTAVAVGEGSGKAPDVQLPESVERIIDRARELGHAAYSDRASVAMVLGGQSAEFVSLWVGTAIRDLDRLEERRREQADRLAQAIEASEGQPDETGPSMNDLRRRRDEIEAELDDGGLSDEEIALRIEERDHLDSELAKPEAQIPGQETML